MRIECSTIEGFGKRSWEMVSGELEGQTTRLFCVPFDLTTSGDFLAVEYRSETDQRQDSSLSGRHSQRSGLRYQTNREVVHNRSARKSFDVKMVEMPQLS